MTSATSASLPRRPYGNWLLRGRPRSLQDLPLENVPGPAREHDGARADRVHPDAVAGQLLGGRRGELDLGRLGRRVGGTRRGAQAGDRGDDDHGSAARVAQVGREARMSSAACPALSANAAVNSPGAALVRLPRPTVPPAFATRRSRPPSAAAISATARSSASISATSAADIATGTPRSASRAAAWARPSALRATRPTATPSAASASAAANRYPAPAGDQRAPAAQSQIHAGSHPGPSRPDPGQG